MASDRRIGTQVALGEGLDLASSPIPACADEVDAGMGLRMVRLRGRAVRPTVSSRSIACAAGCASRHAPLMPSEREQNGCSDGSSSISSACACF